MPSSGGNFTSRWQGSAARSKSIQLNALKAGLLPPDDAPVVDESARLTMNSAIDNYLDYLRKHRNLRTCRTYRSTSRCAW
ncbi:MAG: hypothetical protein ABSF28_09455 [Terracidiphilus sp.]